MTHYEFPLGAFALVQHDEAVTLPHNEPGPLVMTRFNPGFPQPRQMMMQRLGRLLSADAPDYAVTVAHDDTSIVLAPVSQVDAERQHWRNMGGGIVCNPATQRCLTVSQERVDHGGIALHAAPTSHPAALNQTFYILPLSENMNSLAEMPPITTVNWGEQFNYQPQPCAAPVQQPHLFASDDWMLKPATSFWSLNEMPPIVTVPWGEKEGYVQQPCTTPRPVENLWAFDNWFIEPSTSFWA